MSTTPQNDSADSPAECKCQAAGRAFAPWWIPVHTPDAFWLQSGGARIGLAGDSDGKPLPTWAGGVYPAPAPGSESASPSPATAEPTREGEPPCGGSRCYLNDDETVWVHSSKSYSSCAVHRESGNTDLKWTSATARRSPASDGEGTT